MNHQNNSEHINSTIQCTVGSCCHHSGKGYCTLNQIHVGCCDTPKATSCKATECASFQLCNEGGCR